MNASQVRGISRIVRWWQQRRYRIQAKALPYILLLPALALLCLIILYPVARQIYTSFHFNQLMRPLDTRFIGLGNYLKAFKDEEFWGSLKRTGAYVGITIFFQFSFGFVLALLLNQEFKGRGIVRTLFLFPWVVPSVAAVLMWSWMLNARFGVINDILCYRLHLTSEYIPWLSQPRTALVAATLPAIWKGVPFFTVTLLAALQAIPIELYEAAEVDGAGSWAKLRKITLPLITPTIVITLMLRTIWVANYVTHIWLLTGGGPGTHSTTLAVYTLKIFRSRMDVGYPSALAILLGLMVGVFILLYMRYLSRVEEML